MSVAAQEDANASIAVARIRIKEIAATRARYGYRRIHVLLRRENWRVNAERVYRLYREMGLQLRPKHGVTLDFSRPGKPTDNASIESFDRKLRDESLNVIWFMSLDDAR